MDTSLAIPFLRHPRPNLPHPVCGHGEPSFQFCLLCHCLISSLAYIISPLTANVKYYFASPQNNSRPSPPRPWTPSPASCRPRSRPHSIFYIYYIYPLIKYPIPYIPYIPHTLLSFLINTPPCLSTFLYKVPCGIWHSNGMSSGRGAAIPAHSLLPPNPSSPLGARAEDNGFVSVRYLGSIRREYGGR
jgi:hypothetical protein